MKDYKELKIHLSELSSIPIIKQISKLERNVEMKDYNEFLKLSRFLKIHSQMPQLQEPRYYFFIFHYTCSINKKYDQFYKYLDSNQEYFKNPQLKQIFVYFLILNQRYVRAFDILIDTCEEIKTIDRQKAAILYQKCILLLDMQLKMMKNRYEKFNETLTKTYEFAIIRLDKLQHLMPFQQEQQQLYLQSMLRLKLSVNQSPDSLDLVDLIVKSMVSAPQHSTAKGQMNFYFSIFENHRAVQSFIQYMDSNQIELGNGEQIILQHTKKLIDNFLNQFYDSLKQLEGVDALLITDTLNFYKQQQIIKIHDAKDLVYYTLQYITDRNSQFIRQSPLQSQQIVAYLKQAFNSILCMILSNIPQNQEKYAIQYANLNYDIASFILDTHYVLEMKEIVVFMEFMNYQNLTTLFKKSFQNYQQYVQFIEKLDSEIDQKQAKQLLQQIRNFACLLQTYNFQTRLYLKSAEMMDQAMAIASDIYLILQKYEKGEEKLRIVLKDSLNYLFRIFEEHIFLQHNSMEFSEESIIYYFLLRLLQNYKLFSYESIFSLRILNIQISNGFYDHAMAFMDKITVEHPVQPFQIGIGFLFQMMKQNFCIEDMKQMYTKLCISAQDYIQIMKPYMSLNFNLENRQNYCQAIQISYLFENYYYLYYEFFFNLRFWIGFQNIESSQFRIGLREFYDFFLINRQQFIEEKSKVMDDEFKTRNQQPLYNLFKQITIQEINSKVYLKEAIFGIQYGQFVQLWGDIMCSVYLINRKDEFILPSTLYKVGEGIMNMSIVYEEEQDKQYFHSMWRNIYLALDLCSRVINLCQGYGINFSSFTQENINKVLFSWSHVARLLNILKFQFEKLLRPFLKNSSEFKQQITSLSGKVLSPKLKVILTGLDKLNFQNLMDCPIDFEFIAEQDGKQQILTDSQEQEFWKTRIFEKINFFNNFYFPILYISLKFTIDNFPINFQDYQSRLIQKVLKNRSNIDVDGINIWATNEPGSWSRCLENLYNILENIDFLSIKMQNSIYKDVDAMNNHKQVKQVIDFLTENLQKYSFYFKVGLVEEIQQDFLQKTKANIFSNLERYNQTLSLIKILINDLKKQKISH